MPYRVEWLSSADVNLQRIWLYWQQEGAALSPVVDVLSDVRSRELRAITDASAEIELAWQRTPLLIGEAFRDDPTRRIYAKGPLIVVYAVFERDHRVKVVAISYDDRRN